MQTAVRAGVYPKGHTRRTVRLDLMRSMRPFIVELGLATEPELDHLSPTRSPTSTTPT